MRQVRIRWRNVARVGAALAAVAAAVFVAPALLAPPEPGPLPDDVGLETGATGVAYEVRDGPKAETRRRRPKPEPERLEMPERVATPERHRGDDEAEPVAPAPVASPAPAPPPAPAPVAPAPAPPVDAAPPSDPEPSSPVREEFGFEP
jgi:translation initiation factor IF-2